MKDIKIIEEGAEQLFTALGILPERAEELKDLCCEAVGNSKNVAEVMDTLQKYANHANELAYINYRIGRCVECPGTKLKSIFGNGKSISDFFDEL